MVFISGDFFLLLFLSNFSFCFFLPHYHKSMETTTQLSIFTHTDQTIVKVSQHLFYLYFSFYRVLPHPRIHPIAPVPAVHPCVIDGGVHPFFPPQLNVPLSPKPLHPPLLPVVTRWLTTCLQPSTKAAITLHVQQR